MEQKMSRFYDGEYSNHYSASDRISDETARDIQKIIAGTHTVDPFTRDFITVEEYEARQLLRQEQEVDIKWYRNGIEYIPSEEVDWMKEGF
jgi:hypothetical protein